MADNIIRVPVKQYVVSLLESQFPSKNGLPFIDLVDRTFFESCLINFLKLKGEKHENYFPKENEPFIYLKTKKQLGYIGLNEFNSMKLGLIIEKYAREILVRDVFFYQSLPGISITEAIIIVLSKYDIYDVQIGTLRRHFDRMMIKNNVFIVDRNSINHKINHTMKKVYDQKFADFLTSKPR
jgi:hypothetical protein